MATIHNPTPYSLFSHVLGRSLAADEVLDGLSDADAEAACESGTFERGVLAIPEEATVTVTNDELEVEEEKAEEDEEEAPKRPAGRPRSIRGSVEVEEVVEVEREER